MSMKDRVCGCDITPADRTREIALLRKDIASLERKIFARRDMGEEPVGLSAYQEILRRRIAVLEAGE